MGHRYDEETLGDLIAHLQPPPPGWAEAAKELPAARRAMDSIVERAEADAEFRARAIEDLEQALRREGVEPLPRLVNELRGRLSDEG
jgi:hypothetical protein